MKYKVKKYDTKSSNYDKIIITRLKSPNCILFDLSFILQGYTTISRESWPKLWHKSYYEKNYFEIMTLEVKNCDIIFFPHNFDF